MRAKAARIMQEANEERLRTIREEARRKVSNRRTKSHGPLKYKPFEMIFIKIWK